MRLPAVGLRRPAPRDSVLFVCHGNIARSPAAERLARRAYAVRGWSFDSAGIGAVVGHGVAEHIDDALRRRGVDPSGHAAKQLQRRHLTAAEYVLALDLTHLAWILDQWPEFAGRVFLLGEAAALAGTGRANNRDALASAACSPPGLQIEDPYLRGSAVAEHAVAEIEAAVEALAPLLPDLRLRERR
ncbi:MAG: hypothetical protein Q4E05_02680 [Pseudoclavibacter sp.]|nr:hypothetical protein [Pseudoclavibacter sp.]